MIKTTSARIDVGVGHEHAWADIDQAVMGQVGVVSFMPQTCGTFWLAHQKDFPAKQAVIFAPGPQYADDIAREGWVLDSEIQRKV